MKLSKKTVIHKREKWVLKNKKSGALKSVGLVDQKLIKTGNKTLDKLKGK
jgi:hypothetical protein